MLRYLILSHLRHVSSYNRGNHFYFPLTVSVTGAALLEKFPIAWQISLATRTPYLLCVEPAELRVIHQAHSTDKPTLDGCNLP